MSLFHSLALVAISAAPVAAFWRLPCASPVVVERADPIVNPGTVSGHLHTIMGGNAFDFTMDYQKTQTSDCTSCQVHGDLSNYWIPTLYYKHQNGTYEQVQQNGGMLVYYLQRKGNDNEQLHAFPEGFRMIAGNPYKRSGGNDFASQAISYNCLDYSGQTHHDETGGFPDYNCPNGLRSQVFFPACWDGKNLDSSDHKSHVAYPVDNYNNGKCPDSHPVHLISIFYEIIWETDKFANMWYGNTQPFVWSMGDPTGYGLHGDFLNGWDVDLLQRAVDNCNNDSGRVEDCQEFQLYSAQQAGQCKKQSPLTDALNFIDALPGCNPISYGPEEAKPSTCASSPVVPGQSSAGDSSTSEAAHTSTRVSSLQTQTTLITSSTRPAPSSSKTYASKSHSQGQGSYVQAAGTQAPGSFYTTPTSSSTYNKSTSTPISSTTTDGSTDTVPTSIDSAPASSTPKTCKRNPKSKRPSLSVKARHAAIHDLRSGRMGSRYH